MQKFVYLILGTILIYFAAPQAQARGLVYCVKSENLPIPITNEPGQFHDVWHSRSFTLTKVEADKLTGQEFLEAYRSQNGEDLYETLEGEVNTERTGYSCGGSGDRFVDGGHYAVIQFSYDSYGIRSAVIRVGFGASARAALDAAKDSDDPWSSNIGIEDGYQVLDRGRF